MPAINEAGLTIIKVFEGFRAAPYLDPVGVPTIGYGSIWDTEGNRVTMDHPPVSEAEAETLLLRELRHVVNALWRLVVVPLSDNQFSALASFTYNVGSGNLQRSTLRQKLNRKDYEGAVAELPKWRRAGGRILPGLVRRRAAEVKLWTTVERHSSGSPAVMYSHIRS